jgi:hypothetical protein
LKKSLCLIIENSHGRFTTTTQAVRLRASPRHRRASVNTTTQESVSVEAIRKPHSAPEAQGSRNTGQAAPQERAASGNEPGDGDVRVIYGRHTPKIQPFKATPR